MTVYLNDHNITGFSWMTLRKRFLEADGEVHFRLGRATWDLVPKKTQAISHTQIFHKRDGPRTRCCGLSMSHMRRHEYAFELPKHLFWAGTAAEADFTLG